MLTSRSLKITTSIELLWNIPSFSADCDHLVPVILVLSKVTEVKVELRTKKVSKLLFSILLESIVTLLNRTASKVTLDITDLLKFTLAKVTLSKTQSIKKESVKE